MSTHNDDALSWAGDEDRLVTGAPQNTQRDARSASFVKEQGDPGESSAPQGLSSIALVGFGIFGGVYLLYSVAWLITALRGGLDELKLHLGLRDLNSIRSEAERGREWLERQEPLSSQRPRGA